jgi:predicted Zn finger-like uncharacterized protein
MDCPHCHAQILDDDVNLNNLVAKCRRCHEVFSFANQVAPPSSNASPSHPARLPAPRPENFRIEEMNDRKRIIHRWFSPMYIGLIAFCLFWDGFLVLWYVIGFTQNGPLMMLLFPLIHVAIGLFLTYFTVAGFFNRTFVDVVADGRLVIQHGPLPWFGNRSLEIAVIRQFFCEQTPVWSRSDNTRSTPWYSVNALVGDQKVKLLGNLEKGQALFYKQQLEEWLSIQPALVPGAVT